MTRILALAISMFIYCASCAQSTLTVKVINAQSNSPISNANVLIQPGNLANVTDSNGIVIFKSITATNVNLEVSHIGFVTSSQSISLQPNDNFISTISLEPQEEEEEEVFIQSTRSTRTIRDIPTRVEFIAGEELDEKANMKPGDIRMVLTESTGIQTQQTSATSGNSSIRIQGLDGRYTQVLKDGFPLYAGFSGGLGLLQTPPLDLKQIEVIKGSASTLFGGGAIAGLVNLISKTPGEEREIKFHLDFTSAGGINSSGFYGEKYGKTGLTVFASRNSNTVYAPDGVIFSAIPKFERYTINPRFFVYFNDRTTLTIGTNFTTEERLGGDIDFIKEKKPSGFFEKNESDRISTQVNFEHRLSNKAYLTVRNSYNFFKRGIELPGYVFQGRQHGTFTEATYALHGKRHEWIGGLNLVTDHFSETEILPQQVRNYDRITTGAFIQNNWRVNEKFALESGLRADHVRDHGLVVLPRVSALFTFSNEWSSRVGGGLGYKTPTIFTEESERIYYRNVNAINDDYVNLEKSYGLNADINYKTRFGDGDWSFSINHLFFYTRINDPLVLESNGPVYQFVTHEGHMDSKGMETNAKLGYGDFKLFLGYTFTKAYMHVDGSKMENFLTPRHRINSVLLYEVEEKWKAGLEAYYFDDQRLSDGMNGRSYWIMGFMVERLWEKFSLYINFENFLDSRQTRFDSIYTGSLSNPVFRDIYAPVDGFVVNGGIKLFL